MSVTLKINSFTEANILEESYLPDGADSGATSVVVQNNNKIEEDYYAFIGTPADENSELTLISAVNGTTLTVAALLREHKKLARVLILKADKYNIYRATNVDGTAPADGSFSLLDNVDIDTDDVQTTFVDDDGGAGFWYKFTLFNTETEAESDLADATPTRGGGYLAYATLSEIRQRAGLKNNRFVTDEMIDLKRQAAQQVINAELGGIYTVPFTAPINDLVREMTCLLAAGYLLTDNYGPLNTLNTNEGQQMIDRVMNDKKTGFLDRLATKGLTIKDPTTGADTSIPGTGRGFTGYPMEETEDAPRNFHYKDRY